VANVGEWLKDDVKLIKRTPWPPKVDELEEDEELPSLIIMQLLSALCGKKGSASQHPLARLSLHTMHNKETHRYCH
jgi:hypothetical protein